VEKIGGAAYHENGFIVLGDFDADSHDVVCFNAEGPRYSRGCECAVTLAARVDNGYELGRIVNAMMA
jgi:hypothetical protein